MPAFDCSHQWRLSSFGGLVDVGLAVLDEEGGGGQVAVVAGAEQRSHLGVVC